MWPLDRRRDRRAPSVSHSVAAKCPSPGYAWRCLLAVPLGNSARTAVPFRIVADLLHQPLLGCGSGGGGGGGDVVRGVRAPAPQSARASRSPLRRTWCAGARRTASDSALRSGRRFPSQLTSPSSEPASVPVDGRGARLNTGEQASQKRTPTPSRRALAPILESFPTACSIVTTPLSYSESERTPENSVTRSAGGAAMARRAAL